MEGEDRSTYTTGPVTNSPVSSGDFEGPVTYNYSGTTEVNIADSITIKKEYLQRMPQDYAVSLEQLTTKINEEINKRKSSF